MSRTSQEIRRAFLDYFRRQGHEVLLSGPIVPPNDPSLLFANAGMVQFKDVFTGREQRPYRRAATSQKCIRISGKHNDLEAVGPSPRHHTFFEMLGNFSFGDYFKEEAILFAWEFLTKDLGLPPERLLCTYFAGDAEVPTDEFARDLWKKVTGFGDERVRGLGRSDNFWQMGDTGPCGPSSEIYFCHGPTVDPNRLADEQDERGNGWMEIWNLVFMQFERSKAADGSFSLAPLPAPSIDTGAGLERLAGVVQGKLSNYDTDVLRALIDRAASVANKPYGGTMSPDDVSMRVIADHARTAAFMVAEGILPDKTGRQYVLRRVMRRAIRHGHRLGVERPFLHEVADEVIERMGADYAELRERRDHVLSVIEHEEVRFRDTITRGLGLLDDEFAALAGRAEAVLDGRTAFRLYDTFGFPLDLTRVICAERGVAVDEDGYEAALREAKEKSSFHGVEQAVEGVYREALASAPGERVQFSGYERDEDQAAIVALVRAGALVAEATEGDEVEVVTDRTPFYGESGGQVGDRGVIRVDGGELEVSDTQKPLDGLVVHRALVRSGRVSVGQRARLAIDVGRRSATRRNHSATHLLHLALRRVLGPHAQQKGSVVGPDRLRFDFTHPQPVTSDELRRIEDLVNAATLANDPVQTAVLSIEEARARGAMMIFEEKYGDTVRMLTMGESVELCGGTHARATGDIGLVKIVSEQGIAAGVRRIEAVTGLGALAHVREAEERLGRAAALAKTNPTDLPDRVEKLLASQRALEKQVDELQRKVALGGGGGLEGLAAGARELGGARVLALRTEVTDRGALRELAEQLRDKLGDAIVLLGSEADGKAQLVLTVSKALTTRWKAGELIKSVAAHVGGTGGGRPDMAQAGGADVAQLDAAISSLYDAVAAG